MTPPVLFRLALVQVNADIFSRSVSSARLKMFENGSGNYPMRGEREYIMIVNISTIKLCKKYILNKVEPYQQMDRIQATV